MFIESFFQFFENSSAARGIVSGIGIIFALIIVRKTFCIIRVEEEKNIGNLAEKNMDALLDEVIYFDNKTTNLADTSTISRSNSANKSNRLVKTSKGNFLLISVIQHSDEESDFDRDYFAMDTQAVKRYLLEYDLVAYKTLFGEPETY